MIFLIFITTGELFMFADNTTIFTVGDNTDAIIKTMQVILDQVLILYSANRLITHETKSESQLLSIQIFIGSLVPLKYGENIEMSRKNQTVNIPDKNTPNVF